jgi:FixJ family two-component response regulator
MSNKPRVVVLCPDQVAARAIADVAGRIVELVWVRDVAGFKLAVRDQDILAALVDNDAIPAEAIDLLRTLRELSPRTRRVMLTDHCDLSMIVQGLHTGSVQQIVYKPVFAPELMNALGPIPNLHPQAMTQSRPMQQRSA